MLAKQIGQMSAAAPTNGGARRRKAETNCITDHANAQLPPDGSGRTISQA